MKKEVTFINKGITECMRLVSDIIQTEDYQGRHEIFTKEQGDNTHVILRRFGDLNMTTIINYDEASGELQTIHLNDEEVNFFTNALLKA